MKVSNECTEFVVGSSDSDIVMQPDAFHFAFVCPRCNELNAACGDPESFRDEVLRCFECDYAFGVASDELEQFVEEHRDDECPECGVEVRDGGE